MLQCSSSKVSWLRAFCLAAFCLLVLGTTPQRSCAKTDRLGDMDCYVKGTFDTQAQKASLYVYVDDNANLYVATRPVDENPVRGFIHHASVYDFAEALVKAKKMAIQAKEQGLTWSEKLFRYNEEKDFIDYPVELTFVARRNDSGIYSQLLIDVTDFDNPLFTSTAHIFFDDGEFDEFLQIMLKYSDTVRRLQGLPVPQQSGAPSTDTSSSNSNISVAPTLPPNIAQMGYEAQCKQMTKGYIKDITIRGTGYILGTNVNLRDGHSTKSNVITRMQNGQEVQFLRYYDDETPWYYIRLKNGQCGWGNGDFVDSGWGFKRMEKINTSKLTMTERIHLDVWKRFRTPSKFRATVKENISSTRSFCKGDFEGMEAYVNYELSAPGIKAIYCEGGLGGLTVTAKGMAPFGSLDITSTKEQVLQKLGRPRLIEIDGKRYYFEYADNGAAVVYCDGIRKDNMTVTELFNMGSESEYEFSDADDDLAIDRISFKFNTDQQVVSMKWYCVSD